MGSVQNAFRTGFVCRLCSKIERNVIHIYGKKGKNLKLLQIIRKYLSISVLPKDKLPKTVCQNCAHNIIQQYNFIKSVEKKKKFFLEYQNRKLPINDLLSNRGALGRGT